MGIHAQFPPRAVQARALETVRLLSHYFLGSFDGGGAGMCWLAATVDNEQVMYQHRQANLPLSAHEAPPGELAERTVLPQIGEGKLDRLLPQFVDGLWVSRTRPE